MITKLRSIWPRVVPRGRHDDVGASVVEVAIVAAGLATLAFGVMAAISALVDNQLPGLGG